MGKVQKHQNWHKGSYSNRCGDPVSFNITEAAIHDVNAMDWINYEPFACYIFDRGYWDLERLYRIELTNSFFVIREKRKPKFKVLAGDDLLNGKDNVLRDQNVRFSTIGNAENYPSEIRRIVYYDAVLNEPSLIIRTTSI